MIRFLILLVLFVRPCAATTPPPAEWTGEAGPFQVELRLGAPNAARDAGADLASAGAMLERHWRQLGRAVEGSEIAQVNALAGQRSGRMGRLSYDAVLRGLQWKDRTDGAVDLLAGPLRRWITAGGALPAPDSVMALVRDGGAYFVDLGVLLRSPGMELDLDPLADGLLADRALDTLRARGHKVVAVRVGRVWRTGAQDSLLAQAGTVDGGSPMWLRGRALAVATTASVMVDPRTGTRPAAERAARVLAPTAEEARVWAETLVLLGPGALDKLKQRPGVDAEIRDGEGVQRTPGYDARESVRP
jgi:thiamine biosynthesis lipoprotein ApbE